MIDEVPRMIQRLLTTILRGYRLLFSPWLGSQCRFEPTCSVYAIESIERHGAAMGSYLALRRVVRCHPWCAGGIDPVPHDRPRWLGRFSHARHDQPTSRPGPSA